MFIQNVLLSNLTSWWRTVSHIKRRFGQEESPMTKSRRHHIWRGICFIKDVGGWIFLPKLHSARFPPWDGHSHLWYMCLIWKSWILYKCSNRFGFSLSLESVLNGYLVQVLSCCGAESPMIWNHQNSKPIYLHQFRHWKNQWRWRSC